MGHSVSLLVTLPCQEVGLPDMPKKHLKIFYEALAIHLLHPIGEFYMVDLGWKKR